MRQRHLPSAVPLVEKLPFYATVIDLNGQMAGSYSDPVEFARRVVSLWQAASGQQRGMILIRNAYAIDWAAAYPEATAILAPVTPPILQPPAAPADAPAVVVKHVSVPQGGVPYSIGAPVTRFGASGEMIGHFVAVSSGGSGNEPKRHHRRRRRRRLRRQADKPQE
jgi:hypothetical protein